MIPNEVISKEALAPLFNFQSVHQFAKTVKNLDNKAGARLWTERNGKQLQEAISLSAFSRALDMAQCKLCIDDPPDGQVEDSEGHIRGVEITMVTTPNRPISAQFLDVSNPRYRPKIDSADHRQLQYVEDNWEKWILLGIERKLDRYGVPCFSDLLVYNNVEWLFDRSDGSTLRNQIALLVPPQWKGTVWQHSSNRLDQLWPTPQRHNIPMMDN